MRNEKAKDKARRLLSLHSRPEDWSFGLPSIPTNARRSALWVSAAGLFAWSLTLRLVDLGGSLNLDSVYFWFPWTEAFWTAVEAGDWRGTFLASHPGVLLMWLAGASMKWQGVLAGAPTPENIVAAKLPIALMNALAPPAIFAIAVKRLGHGGFWLAFAMALLWLSEPFMVSHGRLFYMDVPFASWSALGIWLCAVSLKTRSFAWCAVAGIAFGLAAATRLLPTLTVLAGVGVWFGAYFGASRGRDGRLTGLFVVLGVVALAVLAALWPSFLFEPVQTLEKLYATTSRLATAGHRTYFWGSTAGDPGAAFYLATLLTKTSPEVLLCAALGLFVALSKSSLRPLSLGLISAYLPYLAAIVWSDKKVGRYLIDAYPTLLFFSAVGLIWLIGLGWRALEPRLHGRCTLALVSALLISLGCGRTLRLVPYIPHLAAWCADYPGLPCDRLIAFRPFIGLRDTAQWIEMNEPNRRPRVYVTHFGRSPKKNVMPWLDYDVATRVRGADYLVVINSILKRGFRNPAVIRIVDTQRPVYRFTLGSREFVRVYKLKRRNRVTE